MADKVDEYDIEVRQFCIEQAVRTPNLFSESVVIQANAYYDFITAKKESE